MFRKSKILTVILPLLGMLILILDSKTALSAAKDGITVCLYTVVPSLFPFFFLASLLSASIGGKPVPLLSRIGKICRIPKGAEGLLLIGLLGGYPVGAKSIREAYELGCISKRDANRLLSFCNNPGPAFLLGISGALFSSPLIPLIIYTIVIASSILTGILLPGGRIIAKPIPQNAKKSSLHTALYATASVCGWVIIFRLLINFLEKWVLWLIPDIILVMITGIFELTNGCIMLTGIENSAMKFIFLTVFMVFGGLCVMLQTMSVAKGLSMKSYLVGKMIQTYIAFTLSLWLSQLLFPGNIPVMLSFIMLLPIIPLMKMKNTSGKYLLIGV